MRLVKKKFKPSAVAVVSVYEEDIQPAGQETDAKPMAVSEVSSSDADEGGASHEDSSDAEEVEPLPGVAVSAAASTPLPPGQIQTEDASEPQEERGMEFEIWSANLQVSVLKQQNDIHASTITCPGFRPIVAEIDLPCGCAAQPRL